MIARIAAVGLMVLGVGMVAACADDTAAPPPTTEATTATDPAPTSTEPPTTTRAATPTIQLFFLDEDAFAIGRLPYLRPVERDADPDGAELLSLQLLFEGPTADEFAAGLRFVPSEASGVASLEIVDRTAHVVLAGGCSSGGSTFTVADHIVGTLVQFTSIDVVKIYDPDGETGSPDDPGDSIPFCLEP